MDAQQQWLLAYEAGIADEDSTVWLREADEGQVAQFLQLVTDLPNPEQPQQRLALDLALAQLVLRTRDANAAGTGLSEELQSQMVYVYRQLGESHPLRYRLLQCLAVSGTSSSLRWLAELLADDPPQDASQVAVILSPLLQPSRMDDLPRLFPRILDGLGNLSAAASIIDLANFVTRKGLVAQHPAYERRDQLATLLGQLTMRLERLDEQDGETVSAEQLSQRVAESVSLVVSLCDALALIGDQRAIGKLNQALELRHRRIHTEAAAALARLGDKIGSETLVALAAEPVARLRVLAYAEELGILDKVAPEHRAEVAQAEAALVLWLADPTHLGLPPTSCELLDSRELYWPGYSEPVMCYLFRYQYEISGGRYSNIGITGPITHAFSADLESLTSDEIYAAYAGWQAEHEEIFEYDLQRLDYQQRRHMHALEDRLREEGLSQIQPQKLASFFGNPVLVAQALREDRPGLAVVDDQQMQWYPAAHQRRPLGPADALNIYKGKQLLEAFN